MGHGAQGLLGVRHQVDDDLVQAVAVGPHRGQVGREVELHAHVVGPQRVREELERLVHDVVELHREALRRAPAGQGEEVLHDARAALAGRQDPPGPLRVLFLERALQQQGGVAGDDRQRVVELVGDSGEERAHRGELLGLGEGRLLALGARALLDEAAVTVQAEEAPDARAQLEPVVGLRHEVVGPGLEAGDARLAVVEGRDEDDGHLGEPGVLAEAAAGLEAVDARHHDVEQDEVGRRRRRGLERLEAALARGDAQVVRGEQRAKRLAVARLVVHDEYDRL